MLVCQPQRVKLIGSKTNGRLKIYFTVLSSPSCVRLVKIICKFCQ